MGGVICKLCVYNRLWSFRGSEVGFVWRGRCVRRPGGRWLGRGGEQDTDRRRWGDTGTRREAHEGSDLAKRLAVQPVLRGVLPRATQPDSRVKERGTAGARCQVRAECLRWSRCGDNTAGRSGKTGRSGTSPDGNRPMIRSRSPMNGGLRMMKEARSRHDEVKTSSSPLLLPGCFSL
jgi:hypothetical protein